MKESSLSNMKITYVCFELVRRIQARMDLNRNFPGNEEGDLVEHTASRLVEDIVGADMCIDLHSSNVFIWEIPQVRLVDQTDQTLIEYAKMLNVDFVWIHKSKTVLEATLVHTLNSLGVPSMAIEMGGWT